jgi:hypothetical protein
VREREREREREWHKNGGRKGERKITLNKKKERRNTVTIQLLAMPTIQMVIEVNFNNYLLYKKKAEQLSLFLRLKLCFK